MTDTGAHAPLERVIEHSPAARSTYQALGAVLAQVAAEPHRLREILDSSGLALVAFDASRRIGHANPLAAGFFGYEVADLDGATTDLLVPERLRQPDAPLMVASSDVVQLELPGRFHDGSELLVEWRYGSVPASDGPIFIMEVRDRAELDRADEALRASEERFRLLVDGVRDHALFLLDAQGRVSTWNTGAARIKGWSEQEILGQPYEIFFTPEDRARGLPQSMLATARTEGKVEVTGIRQRKDGSRFWAHAQLTALRRPDGELRGYAKLTRDLTDRLRAEENERHLIAERAQREAAEQAEQRVRESEERLARLQRITAALSEAATPAQVAEVILGESLDAVGAAGGAIYSVSNDPMVLELVGQRGHPLEALEHFRSLSLSARAPLSDAARERRPGFFESFAACAERYPELKGAIGAGGFEASAALPLVARNQLIGVLGIRFRTERQFDDGVRSLLMTVSDLCAQALERARLFTAEQEARRDAAAQRDRLQRYFWHTPTPLAMFEGPGHRFVLANPPYQALFGNRPLEGRAVREALPEIGPTGIFDLLDRVFRTGERLDLTEFPAPLPDSTGALADHWFNLSIEPVRAGDAVIGLVTGGFDVTAQVQARRIVEAARNEAERANRVAETARQRLQTLVDEMPLAVIMVDWPSGDVHLANPQVNALLRQPIQGNVKDFFPWKGFRADGSLYREEEWPLSRALRSGATVVSEEIDVALPDGARVWFSVSAAPVRDGQGAIIGAVVLFQDASDRKRAEAEVAAANRAKDEFLAMLGHELRNPLAPIVTAVHLMKLRGGGVLEKERSVIERQVNHLTRLVDDLLDISRITRGMVDLQVQRVEIAEVVAKALEMSSPLLEQRQHHVTISVPRGLPVSGDSTRLSQVVSNILTNAAKYTPPEGHISVNAVERDGRISIAVKDDGIGISAEVIPRIFDLFVQERQKLDRSEGGLGLGLAIVRSLVTLHGGTVTARSEGVGRGSEFVVELPAAAPPDVPEVITQPSADLPAPSPTGRRVLVVDDNFDAADMLAEFLRSQGHAARVAHDGPTALGLLGEFRPDLALLDIGLPVMDGYDLARRLREQMPALQLIAITGYGQTADRRRAADAGFDSHLVKPVEFATLESILSRDSHES